MTAPAAGSHQQRAMTATCDWCGKTRRLTDTGTLERHRVSIPVSSAAVPTVGAGRVRPWCSGSGKAPRRVERQGAAAVRARGRRGE